MLNGVEQFLEEHCNSCAYALWTNQKQMVDGNELHVGNCRRNPPVPLLVSSMVPNKIIGQPPAVVQTVAPAFPAVLPDGWCGEYLSTEEYQADRLDSMLPANG